MDISAETLPGVLWIELALAAPAVALGIAPWLLAGLTGMKPPKGLSTLWLLIGLGLVILWFTLLVHLAYDGWRLLRDGATHLTEWGGIHVGFRAVESLGVVAILAIQYVVVSNVTDGPDAHGIAAIGGLFIVMGGLAALAVVVVLHAGWLLGLQLGRPDEA